MNCLFYNIDKYLMTPNERQEIWNKIQVNYSRITFNNSIFIIKQPNDNVILSADELEKKNFIGYKI